MNRPRRSTTDGSIRCPQASLASNRRTTQSPGSPGVCPKLRRLPPRDGNLPPILSPRTGQSAIPKRLWLRIAEPPKVPAHPECVQSHADYPQETATCHRYSRHGPANPLSPSDSGFESQYHPESRLTRSVSKAATFHPQGTANRLRPDRSIRYPQATLASNRRITQKSRLTRSVSKVTRLTTPQTANRPRRSHHGRLNPPPLSEPGFESHNHQSPSQNPRPPAAPHGVAAVPSTFPPPIGLRSEAPRPSITRSTPPLIVC